MRNLELKIKIKDFRSIIPALKRIGAEFKHHLIQKDTYFNTSIGNDRLKLRETNKRNFTLINYIRPNRCSSKFSSYQIKKLTKPQMLKRMGKLLHTFGEKAVIKKERNLWISGHTRVHLDSVKKLGKFLELETVVSGISNKEARKEHKRMINNLDLGNYKKCAGSYVDMVLKT